MSEKISGRILPAHVDIFHSLCILHAAIHLGNRCEKLEVPVLQREWNYGNPCPVISRDFCWDYFQGRILFTSLFYFAYWKHGPKMSSSYAFWDYVLVYGSGNSREHIGLLIFMLLPGSIRDGMWWGLNWGLKGEGLSTWLGDAHLNYLYINFRSKNANSEGERGMKEHMNVLFLCDICPVEQASEPGQLGANTNRRSPPNIHSLCLNSISLNTVEGTLNHTEEFQIKEL